MKPLFRNLNYASAHPFEEEIITADNFPITATCYQPLVSNNQVVLIGSATGVPQEYYRSFARHMADNGYTVYTFDYRGIGKSRPHSLKKFSATMLAWGKYDLDALIKHIRMNHPFAKLIFIGHSIAGQILSLAPQSTHLSKIILIGSQHANWRLWPLYARFVYAFLMYVLLPLASQLAGYYPGKWLKIFWDLPKGVALEWARWCRSRGGLFDYHSDVPLARIRVPLLAIGFSDDIIAPLRPMNALLEKYSQAAITHWQYSPRELNARSIGHFGFFRPKFRTFLWEPVLEWLEQTENFDKPLMGSLFSKQIGLYGRMN